MFKKAVAGSTDYPVFAFPISDHSAMAPPFKDVQNVFYHNKTKKGQGATDLFVLGRVLRREYRGD